MMKIRDRAAITSRYLHLLGSVLVAVANQVTGDALAAADGQDGKDGLGELGLRRLSHVF